MGWCVVVSAVCRVVVWWIDMACSSVMSPVVPGTRSTVGIPEQQGDVADRRSDGDSRPATACWYRGGPRQMQGPVRRQRVYCSGMALRIVFAEDDFLVREGVAALLGECDDIELVGTVGD